jgi:LmbE family N-acetylglucosaminyl deacetylase
MTSQGEGIGGFLGRMVTSKPDFKGSFASLLGDSGPETGVEAYDDEAEAAAVLDASEAEWLNDRLEADEELDDLEKALIAFIDAETGGQFVPRPRLSA